MTAICIPLTLMAQDSPDTAQTDTAQTARDRSVIVGFLEDNLSGAGRDIRIEGFKGLLSSNATLEELTIADDTGVWFTLRDVELDWSRAALFSGRVEINRITAGPPASGRGHDRAPRARGQAIFIARPTGFDRHRRD